MSDEFNHKHILVTARGLKEPPRKSSEIEDWLRELVVLVNMNVLMGPYAVRCDTFGNEGVTGIVCIETSHASIHVWDTCDVPFAQMDLYSCADFDAMKVIEHFKKFSPGHLDYMVIDRNTKPKILESGGISY